MAIKGKAKTLAPKLRFPEFINGPGWEEKPLAALLAPIVREKEKPLGPYTGLGLRSHGKGTFTKPFEDPDKNSMERLYEVHADDLIVSITFAWEGAIAIARSTDTGALVSHRFPTYTFRTSVALPDFFRYAILDNRLIYELGVISPGGAGRNRVLNKNDFLTLKRFIPSPDEQRKIAACLTSLDEWIAAEGRKLEALRAYKEGLLQQLFPRAGERLPPVRFPEFRNEPEWELRALSHYVSALDAGVSVNAGDRPAREGEIGILKTSCVTSGAFDSAQNKVVVEPEEILRARESVQRDTIIMSRMNTIALVGANAYVERDLPNLFLPDRLWAAKPSGRGDMRFLSYILGSGLGRSFLSSLASGSSGSMKNISKSEVLAMPTAAPASIAEQRRIAACLSALDELIAPQSQKLNGLRAHKKGLMQQLFLSPVPEGV